MKGGVVMMNEIFEKKIWRWREKSKTETGLVSKRSERLAEQGGRQEQSHYPRIFRTEARLPPDSLLSLERNLIVNGTIPTYFHSDIRVW